MVGDKLIRVSEITRVKLTVAHLRRGEFKYTTEEEHIN